MYSKGKELRNILIEGFNDRDESFYYLAPDIVGSVASANMDVDKDIFIIDFSTTDGRDMNLKVKNAAFFTFMSAILAKLGTDVVLTKVGFVVVSEDFFVDLTGGSADPFSGSTGEQPANTNEVITAIRNVLRIDIICIKK